MPGRDLSSADMDVRKFVIRIAAQTGDVLGDRLAGMYVHGSLATGTFLRHGSDIDVLILVDGPLPAESLRALRDALRTLDAEKPVAGALEVTVLERAAALRYEHPVRPLLQLHSTPGSIAAQLMHVKQHGMRLTGAQPQDAIGPIPWHAFMQSVMESFEAKNARVADAPASVVLNACRTLYDVSAPQVHVIDKFAAAQWALERVPAQFHALVRDAARAQETGEAAALDPSHVAAFRDYVAAAAEPAFAKVRDDGEDDEL